jgi:hypothetical protein
MKKVLIAGVAALALTVAGCKSPFTPGPGPVQPPVVTVPPGLLGQVSNITKFLCGVEPIGFTVAQFFIGGIQDFRAIADKVCGAVQANVAQLFNLRGTNLRGAEDGRPVYNYGPIQLPDGRTVNVLVKPVR